jgi:hypothetical protein
LASLNWLKELDISIGNQQFFQPLLSAQLASGLTALTYMGLSGCPVSCLAHVNSCRALIELNVGCPDGLEEVLSPIEWAAVGDLVGLTELHLNNAKMLSPTPEYCAAIAKLTKLQRLGAGMWSKSMLPGLAIFTQLTKLEGGWQQDISVVDGVVLPSVVELALTSGSPPFSALPNLVSVEQYDCLSTCAFTGMAQYCSALRELKVADSRMGVMSMQVNAPLPARIDAWLALSTLTGLTCLDCMVADKYELVVVVDVVCGLLPNGFQLLSLKAVQPTHLLHKHLLLLAKLRGLPELVLQVDSSTEQSTADAIMADVAMFLIAVSGIDSLRLKGLTGEQVRKVVVAARRVKAIHLPCPRSVAFY